MNNQRWYWLIIGLGAVLRFIDLGGAAFWYDEAFSRWTAGMGWDRMFYALAGDTHPPLYYVLLYPLVHAGLDSEFWLRLPSAICSLLALPVAWWIAKALDLPEAARIGGVFFMAISSAQLHYGQETRMYALFQLEILLAVLCILNRWWFGVFLTTVTALYTHNYGLVYGPVLAGIILIRERRLGALWPLVDALLCWLPWAPVLLSQMSIIGGHYWIQPVTIAEEVYAYWMQFFGFAMLDSWKILSGIAVLSVSGLALVRSAQSRNPNLMLLIILGLGPLCLATMISLAWSPILLFRALLPSSAALYLLIAWALSRGPRWQTGYVTALILPICLAGLYGFYHYNPLNKGDLSPLLAQVRERWQPGDVMLHVGDGTLVSFSPYTPDLPQYKLMHCEVEPPGALSPQTRQGLGIVEREFDQIDARRIWVVWFDSPISPACEAAMARAIISHARLIRLEQDSQFFYAGVWLYAKDQIRTP